MSSSGIRDTESTASRIEKLARERNSDIIDDYKNAEEQTSLSSGGPSASTGSSPSGNFMKKDGDEWLSVFGNDFDIAEIDGGFVNISKLTGFGRRLTVLNAEGGLPDNLDTLFPFPDPLIFFEKYIQIVSDDVTLRPPVNFTITNIVGNGVDDVITVTVASTGNLENGEYVDVSAPGGFSSSGRVAIFNVTATTFQYNLGTIGSTTPQTSGNVVRGNLKLPNDVNFLATEGTFLHFIFDTVSQQMVLDYASNGIGGGSGSFPIDFPEEQRGIVGSSTEIIDFTQSDRHAVIMELDGDIELSLINTTVNKLQISSIKLKQDGVGGHAFIGFSQTVANEQVIIDEVDANNAPAGFVEFIVEFTDGLFTAYLKTGNIVSGGDASLWSTFGAIQLVNMAINGTENQTIAGFVDLGGAARGSISGDAGATAVRLSLATNNKFIISDVITDIVSFDDTTGLTIEGSHVINMNKNIINTLGSLQFDRTSTFLPLTIDTIGFDNSENAMKYNVALTTDIHRFQAAGELLGTISRAASNSGLLLIDNVVSDILQADEQLFLSSASTPDPLLNGAVWRDSGTGLFQFRQNGVTVDLGGGSEIFTWSNDHSMASFKLIADAGNDVILNAPTGQGVSLEVDGTQEYLFTPTQADWNGNSFVNVGRIDSDAANLAVSGKIRLGNEELLSWVKLDNVTVVSFGLRNTDLLGITGANLSLVGNSIVDTDTLEGRLSNQLNINVPTNGQILNIQFEGVNEWTFSSSTLGGNNLILNNSLIINDSASNPISNGEFTRNVNILGLFAADFKVQNTTVGSSGTANFISYRNYAVDTGEELGSIRFDGGLSSTQYARILAGVGEATDSGLLSLQVRADNSSLRTAVQFKGDDDNTNTYMTINSRINSDLQFGNENAAAGVFKIAPVVGSTQLAIVVEDNVSFIEGAAGMLAMPCISVFGADSKAQLDIAYGTHKGAIGFSDGTAPGTMYVRQSNGNWSKFIADSIIV